MTPTAIQPKPAVKLPYPPPAWGKPPEGYRWVKLRERLKSSDGFVGKQGQVHLLSTWGLGSIGFTVNRVNSLWLKEGQPLVKYVRPEPL